MLPPSSRFTKSWFSPNDALAVTLAGTGLRVVHEQSAVACDVGPTGSCRSRHKAFLGPCLRYSVEHSAGRFPTSDIPRGEWRETRIWPFTQRRTADSRRIPFVADLAKAERFVRMAGLQPAGLGEISIMPSDRPEQGPDDQIEIDLRQPGVAALWAWLWPGAGHLYQRRYAKGILFMVCILSTYFFGLAMGGGHVVYASWNQTERRWQYFCQLGVGLPALAGHCTGSTCEDGACHVVQRLDGAADHRHAER